ncbi:MAG: polyprenyl synthetase family protein [Firmicutes bacterium]|nr:polyprenyl synthetase family protein [Bacillota bacterium]
MSAFSKLYAEKQNAFEQDLARIFAEIENIPEPLRASMEYSLLDGGKRLRPLLFLEIFSLFKKDANENVLKFAAAIECIHCYSLIHDDLPAMDNDDFRRGKPTNHKVYGEGVAILAGDALLNLAYELMLDAVIDSEDKAAYLKAAALFSKHAGCRGMIAGQVADITADENISVDVLKYVLRHKTGDLIIAACVAAAILGNAENEELLSIRNFAEHFSYAFQIKDDVLDHKQKETEKVSFAKMYGVSRSNQTLGDSSQKAAKELSALKNRDTEFLKQLIIKFASRKE